MSAATRGFTLIEVMIVVVIVAFLAAIGFPSYLSHVRKSARAEAKVRLMQVAQLQERYFTEKNTYVADAAPLLGLAAGATIYSNGNNDASSAYQITVAAGSSGIGTSFTLSAVPQGSQTNDTECATLRLLHTGKKEISGSGNATQCWK
jgi:type IV pilus assembly protein PilE